MNEKDLNFRHLIKTFIPGFFLSVCCIFFLDLIIYKLLGQNYKWVILDFGFKHPNLLIGSLIPFSMFLGIVLNTFCFVYLFPFITNTRDNRDKKKSIKDKKDISLTEFEKIMQKIMVEYYFNHLEIKNANKKNDNTDNKEKTSEINLDLFGHYFDVKTFLLHRQNMENFQFIRTGYFYYLEFQLNSILTIIFAVTVFFANIFLRDITYVIDNKVIFISNIEKLWISSIVLVVSCTLCVLLYKAIIKNDRTYFKKELSYLIGAFHICKAKGDKNFSISDEMQKEYDI